MRTVQLGVLAAAAALLAGCATSRSSNGEADKSVAAILVDVEAAVGRAHSVHVVGQGQAGGSGPIAIDLELVAGRGGAGTIAANGLRFSVVRIGAEAYFRGGPSFWRSVGAPGLVARLSGRWIEVPAASRQFASLVALTNLRRLFGQILGSHGVLAKGGFTTLGGQRAFSLIDASGGGMIFIAADGAPLPVELTPKPGSRGGLRFEGWNRSYGLVAPANSIPYAKLRS